MYGYLRWCNNIDLIINVSSFITSQILISISKEFSKKRRISSLSHSQSLFKPERFNHNNFFAININILSIIIDTFKFIVDFSSTWLAFHSKFFVTSRTLANVYNKILIDRYQAADVTTKKREKNSTWTFIFRIKFTKIIFLFLLFFFISFSILTKINKENDFLISFLLLLYMYSISTTGFSMRIRM